MNDEQRAAWEKAYKKKGELWSRRHERWFETLDCDLILDLGSGTGKSIEGMKGEIISLDFSKTALKLARKRHKSINFICADSARLPFRKCTFDFARASYVLGHLDSRELVHAIEEISRVLKENGKLAVEMFSVSDGRYGKGKQITRHTFLDGNGIIQRYFEMDDIHSSFIGFGIEYLELAEWKQKVGHKKTMKRSVIRAVLRK